MNINELVPSFETCKEAKELGFPQDTSYIGYCNHPNYAENLLMERRYRLTSKDFLDAPTLQEMIAKLPKQCYSKNAQDALEWWNRLRKDGVI